MCLAKIEHLKIESLTYNTPTYKLAIIYVWNDRKEILKHYFTFNQYETSCYGQ